MFDLGAGIDSRVRLNNGLEMPVFGLGVYQSPQGRPTEEAVRAALQSGYRLIDTAALYGNEADVGRAVRASGVARDEVFVTTKLWNSDQGYDTAHRAYERSRELLGLGPIDLYLIHWPVPEKRLESWRALTDLLADGSCRAIGVSNFTIAHLTELLENSDIVPAVNQVEFNPFLYQRGLLEYCQKQGIQLEAWAPLGRARRFGDPTLQGIAETHRKTPAQVMLRWGLERGVVQIPKSIHPDRIRENSELWDFELSAREGAALDRLNANDRTGWNPDDLR